MMQRTYGRRGIRPENNLFNQRAKLDLSSSISEATSVSTCSSNEKENVRPKRFNRRNTADVNKTKNSCSTSRKQTDIPNETQTERMTRRRQQECEIFRNVPDFKELEDYKLLVIPVTPIKTHITTSESTEGDLWDPHQFRSPVPFSPVFRHSSPHSITAAAAQNISASSKTSSHSMETRRMKRLRDRMSPSVETSTPGGQQRKHTRLSNNFSSPAHIKQVSIIEHEDELCNSFQMHVSLNDSAHVQPVKMTFDEDSDSDSVCYSRIQVIPKNSGLSTEDNTMNMFSDLSQYRTAPSLAEIVEEEISSSEDNESSESLEPKSSHTSSLNCSKVQSNPVINLSHSNSDTFYSGISDEHSEENRVHSEVSNTNTPDRRSTQESDANTEHHSRDDQSSDGLKYSRTASLLDERFILQFQQLKSPTLAELAIRGRQKSILRECGQNTLLPWNSYFKKRHINSSDLIKVGEGVYGEVFKFITEDNQQTIIKVVPMGGECTVNEEPQKSLKEMLNEIKVTRILSNQVGHNFITMKSAWCTVGSYPQTLLACWDRFSETKTSENDRPDYFTDDQAYCVFEFCNGGVALESFQFQSTMQSISVLLQVGWSLAAAEAKFQFEHRDLHWGNVLINMTENESISYALEGIHEIHHLQTHGVHTNIIDFTLSRLQHGKEVIYTDLSTDETLFQGYGDYQFDVYRQMKDLNKDDWRSFNAKTNVFWMKYIADKLKAVPCRKTRMKLNLRQRNIELTEFIERCDDYSSTVEMVFKDKLFLDYTEEECDISSCSDGD